VSMKLKRLEEMQPLIKSADEMLPHY